jgi:hypothetical protein
MLRLKEDRTAFAALSGISQFPGPPMTGAAQNEARIDLAQYDR